MSSGTWVYLLVPIANLDDPLPLLVERYDIPCDDGQTRKHPSYREAASANPESCALGAARDGFQLWKCADPSLQAGGDLDQFQALRKKSAKGDAWRLLTATEALDWSRGSAST